MMVEAKAAGKVVEMIPAMGVFSRKAGAGKRKSRIVCCGNYMADRSADELYASGADSTQVSILRKAALESWHILSLDIRSAFLLAPTSQDELIIVQPPRILYDAGLIDHDEVWVVTGAMYGLTTAPRDWASHRDNQLRHLRWTQVILGEERKLGLVPLADPNLWVVKEWKADGKGGVLFAGPSLGYLAVYVDDLLVVAERSTAEKLAQVLDATWPASPPEYVEAGGPAMKFLGMEIQKSEKGDIEVHQHCYAQELLQRNGVVARATHIKVPEEKEDPAPALRTVREAQRLTGELLWLSGKTRPDLAAAVQRMSSRATRNPEWVLELGANVLAHLSTSWEKKLVYTKEVPVDADPTMFRRTPRDREAGTLEVLVDASFGVEEQHSVTGIILLFSGCPVQWESKKQSLAALSTAEAELTAIMEGAQAGRSVRALLELFEVPISMEIYNDNRAALILAGGQGGGWRTRHLRIRANCLAEAIREGEFSLTHRVGTRLWADALTKCLPVAALERFCEGVGLKSVPKVVEHEDVEEQKEAMVKCLLAVVAGGLLMASGGLSPQVRQMKAVGQLVLIGGVAALAQKVNEIGLDKARLLLAGDEPHQDGHRGGALEEVKAVKVRALAPKERRLPWDEEWSGQEMLDPITDLSLGERLDVEDEEQSPTVWEGDQSLLATCDEVRDLGATSESGSMASSPCRSSMVASWTLPESDEGGLEEWNQEGVTPMQTSSVRLRRNSMRSWPTTPTTSGGVGLGSLILCTQPGWTSRR